MQPYRVGNAFAQQSWLRQQTNPSERSATNGSGNNRTASNKHTALHVFDSLIEDVSTPSTTVDELVGPVTETEAAGRAAVARQRVQMEALLQSPSRSPRRRRNTPPSKKPFDFTVTRSSHKRRDTIASKKTRNTTTSGETAPRTPFLDKLKTKVLCNRKLDGNIRQAKVTKSTSNMNTLPNYYDKPLPAINLPVNQAPFPNLLTLPQPWSSPAPFSPSGDRIVYTNSPRTPLNPTTSPFSPSQDWPLRTTFPILRPTSSAFATNDNSAACASAISLSPTRSPSRHTFHPSAIIATTATNGTEYITPVRGGAYAMAARPVLVVVAAAATGGGNMGGMQHAVSMKGSILDVEGFVGSEGGSVDAGAGAGAGAGAHSGAENDRDVTDKEVVELQHGNELELEHVHDQDHDHDHEKDNSEDREDGIVKTTDQPPSIRTGGEAAVRLVEQTRVLSDKIWTVDDRVAGAGVEARLLRSVEHELTSVAVGVARVEPRFTSLEARLDRIEAKLDRIFREQAARVKHEASFGSGRYPGRGL